MFEYPLRRGDHVPVPDDVQATSTKVINASITTEAFDGRSLQSKHRCLESADP